MSLDRRTSSIFGRPLLVLVVLVVLVVLGLVVAGPVSASGSSELDDATARGRQIFLEGRSPSGGTILAVIADGGVEVPAEVMPCSSCHGRDGRGRPEGGIRPSNLSWAALGRTVTAGSGGRNHPPYDERSLKRAITLGSDPAGNRLNAAMPRYQLSHGDLADLVAYLKQLGNDLPPGVDGERIVLLSPRAVGLPDKNLAPVDWALDAAVAEVNARGGIYGRQLELDRREMGGEEGGWDETLAGDDLFAVLAPWAQGHEEALDAAAGRHQVPVLGPLTLEPPSGAATGSSRPWVFYVLPGLDELAGALVRSAAESRGDAGRLVVAMGEGPRFEAAGQRALAEAGGWGGARMVGPAEADELAGLGDADAVLLLADGAGQRSFLAALATGVTGPRLLVPGPLIDRRVFATLPPTRLWATYPTVPPPVEPELWSRLRHRDPRLGERPSAFQAVAVASLELLVTGLERAGRAFDRHRLVAELETLRDHDTGVLPPLTFSPNRRLALSGGYLVTFEADGGPHPRGWVALR